MKRARTVQAMPTVLLLLAVFLGSFLALQWVQGFEPHIYGVDGYYHMAVARLIRADGILHEFPWMQFSLFRDGYADLELLHHLALAPFAGSGNHDLLEARAKAASSLFGASLLALFWFVLRRFRCPWPWFWTAALLLGAGGFLSRLVQLRPDVLSLLLLLWAALLFSRQRQRHWPHMLLGLLFTLNGSTPQLITALALLFLAGRRLAGERPLDWRMPLFTLAGSAAGFIVHPDRGDFALLVARLNWRALLAGLIDGSGVPSTVESLESKSPILESLLLHNELVVLPLAAIVLVLLVRRRPAGPFAGETIALFLCSLGMLGLTVTAARYTLHWALFTMLFSALLLRDLRVGEPRTATPGDWRRTILPALLLLALAGARTHDYVSHRLQAESIKAARPEMREVGAILGHEAAPGDVVFHTRWVYFPQLLFYAPAQYYLVGSDPMLMLAHGDQYLDIWRSLRRGKLADSFPFVRGLFNSRWLLADSDQEQLLRRIECDPRFQCHFRGPNLTLYALRDLELGFISEWMVAPLARGPQTDAESPAGTTSIFTLPLAEPPLVPYHQAPPPNGVPVSYIDFRPFFPLGSMAPPAAMAEAALWLDGQTEAEVRFGCCGPCQLELNGRPILVNRDSNQGALIDQWRIPVSLAGGENRLRVIAARTTVDWGFFLRVVSGEGRPIRFDRP